MKILKVVTTLIVLVFVVVIIRFTLDKQIPYEVSVDGLAIPKFQEVEVPFANSLDHSQSLPFMASAVIDVDNDGIEELFLGGGPGQQDAVLRYENDGFSDITQNVSWTKPEMADATFGAAVIDVDGNGFSDLIIARTTGVWLYLNKNGMFSAERLEVSLKKGSTPLGIAIADLNRDGHFDMYVAGYIDKALVEGQNIFNKVGYGGTSAMFLNNGDNTFTDITESSGLAHTQNTFMGVFIDIDNDNLEDLVVAHDTGHVKTWKNQGDLTFKEMPNPLSEQYGYPMGIAVTDFKNNGLPDFFFSNVGTTPPEFLVKGDLRDDQVFNPRWLMFENQGQFEFEDVAEAAQLADYEFSWGAIFEDFNLDGRDDLVVSENYVGFPAHKIPFLRLPGRFLLQNQNHQFAETGAESNVVNPNYSITPITADFNNDGYPDLVHVNLEGNSKAFISEAGSANYIKVKLKDDIGSIAAKIIVTRSDGKKIHRDFISGEGLCSDQSHMQIFGLGDSVATAIGVKYISGREESVMGEFKNQLVRF